MTGAATVAVWDRAVRMLHWTLAAAMVGGWLTTLVLLGLHEAVGTVALAAALARIVWGWTGPRHARFAGFVRGPAATWRYALQVLHDTEPRHVGHNPLGGWMAVALLACAVGLGISGWLYRSDWLWGDATVEAVHVALAWGVLVLVPLHLAGVAFTSRRQRENLVAAMISGRKPAPRPGDVD